jgi:hypothetical protein
MEKCYTVKKCLQIPLIDADWNKPFWRDIESASVNLSYWNSAPSKNLPKTEVKLQYDDQNLYVIFRVQDFYVRAIETRMHGDVWKDSCVEFFFAPCSENPDYYFNLETNCCGVLLAQHNTGPRQNSRFLDVDDCQKIQVASTASGPIQHEITKPLAWTLEYALPFEVLMHYASIEKAAPGALWRANFYKCADGCSVPHWMSWSPIFEDRPDFHRPDCFGVLNFI